MDPFQLKFHDCWQNCFGFWGQNTWMFISVVFVHPANLTNHSYTQKPRSQEASMEEPDWSQRLKVKDAKQVSEKLSHSKWPQPATRIFFDTNERLDLGPRVLRAPYYPFWEIQRAIPGKTPGFDASSTWAAEKSQLQHEETTRPLQQEFWKESYNTWG